MTVAWGDKEIFRALPGRYYQQDAHLIDKQFMQHCGPDVTYIRHGVDAARDEAVIEYEIGGKVFNDGQISSHYSTAAKIIGERAKRKAAKMVAT